MAIFQLERSVQARHLKAYEAEHHCAGGGAITVRIEGIWREVFEVWAEGDDPASAFGDNGEYSREIGESIDYASPCWVVVRYVMEEKSSFAEVDDAIHRFRTCDLVNVQVPEQMPLDSIVTAHPHRVKRPARSGTGWLARHRWHIANPLRRWC